MCGFRQYLFASFDKTASKCPWECFDENKWFLKEMYLSGSLIEKFWTFDGFFPQVCQNNIQSVQRKGLRDLFLGKYFKSISHSLRNLRWAFQNWILRVDRFILRKIVSYFGNPKLCYSILDLEQKKVCHISKRHRKAPFKTALNCPE